jgi:hypothetical protein
MLHLKREQELIVAHLRNCANVEVTGEGNFFAETSESDCAKGSVKNPASRGSGNRIGRASSSVGFELEVEELERKSRLKSCDSPYAA